MKARTIRAAVVFLLAANALGAGCRLLVMGLNSRWSADAAEAGSWALIAGGVLLAMVGFVAYLALVAWIVRTWQRHEPPEGERAMRASDDPLAGAAQAAEADRELMAYHARRWCDRRETTLADLADWLAIDSDRFSRFLLNRWPHPGEFRYDRTVRQIATANACDVERLKTFLRN